MTAHAFILLGGLVGEDGWVDSAGMLELEPMLDAIGVTHDTFPWSEYADAAAKWYSYGTEIKRILIGYSGGGSRATWLANLKAKPPIDLMVLYDPSPAWQMQPIGDNVKQAICYHNTAPDMPVPFLGNLGGGVLTALKYADGQPQAPISTIDIVEQHLLVQGDRALHAHTIAAVKNLISAPE